LVKRPNDLHINQAFFARWFWLFVLQNAVGEVNNRTEITSLEHH